jgi:hypothetical protein
MTQKYLLYIDILGFSNMVSNKRQVEEVYHVIDRLHVHRHHAFTPIAFSDTVLVYNREEATSASAHQYLVMYSCEFAQDLFYRLISKDIHFRAFLTEGDFEDKQLQNVRAFYGEALTRSYRREKVINCTGLFIDNCLLKRCDIFHTTHYDEACSFVHIMQTLENVSVTEENYPIDPMLITSGSLEYLIAYDLVYLKRIHQHMNNHLLPTRIREKYLSAWHMISGRHRDLLHTYERSGFNPRALSDFDWTEAMSRVGTQGGFHE